MKHRCEPAPRGLPFAGLLSGTSSMPAQINHQLNKWWIPAATDEQAWRLKVCQRQLAYCYLFESDLRRQSAFLLIDKYKSILDSVKINQQVELCFDEILIFRSKPQSCINRSIRDDRSQYHFCDCHFQKIYLPQQFSKLSSSVPIWSVNSAETRSVPMYPLPMPFLPYMENSRQP